MSKDEKKQPEKDELDKLIEAWVKDIREGT